MSDIEYNKQHLFNNCSPDPKEPIKGLVLTDDETRIIAERRKEMWKVVKEMQVELREFESIWWYKFLNEKGAEEEKELHRNTVLAIRRKINEKCFEGYGFYLGEVLMSRTRTSVNLENIYKIVKHYRQNGKPIPPSKEAEYHIKINDILSGNIKDFEEFIYKGRPIFEIPDEELPYSALVEKKHDHRLWLKYRWMIHEYQIKLRDKKAGHQAPTKRSDSFEGIYIPDRKTIPCLDTEQKRTFQKIRPEKMKSHTRENILSLCRKKGIKLGYWRRNVR